MTRAGKVAGFAGALLGAGALAFWLNEKASETPPFTAEVEDAPYAIRRYPSLLVAETRAGGDREAAVNRGFERLGRYIFGRERPDGNRERIAMTAPVLADRAGGDWRTRFVMPAKFDAATLPQPGIEVTTATLPARRVAAITFAGRASDTDLHDRERDLRAWLLARGERPIGPAEYAFYNSPFIPGPLRRNEVLLPLG